MADDLADDLLAACRVLDGEGLTDAFGHVSARLPEGGLTITPRLGPGLVRDRGQLLRLDAAGAVVDGDASLLPGEAPVHTGVLAARPDVGAVARTHGPWGQAWATTASELPVVLGQGMFLGGPVGVHDSGSTVTDADGAAALAATLGDGTAVLMRGFGQVVTGASVAEAVVRAVFLERMAAAALRAAPAGGAQPFDQAQIDAFMSRPGPRAEQVARAWTYLRSRHDGAREALG